MIVDPSAKADGNGINSFGSSIGVASIFIAVRLQPYSRVECFDLAKAGAVYVWLSAS